jgi:hypothetical protein
MFSFAPKYQILFGIDSNKENKVEAHVDKLAAILLGGGNQI